MRKKIASTIKFGFEGVLRRTKVRARTKIQISCIGSTLKSSVCLALIRKRVINVTVSSNITRSYVEQHKTCDISKYYCHKYPPEIDYYNNEHNNLYLKRPVLKTILTQVFTRVTY